MFSLMPGLTESKVVFQNRIMETFIKFNSVLTINAIRDAGGDQSKIAESNKEILGFHEIGKA